VANPRAGADRAPELLAKINERLRSSFELDIVLTLGPGDAAQATESAARDGYERVFVAGGDGTLNEAVNGVGRVPGALERTIFGVIPLGTGNDFARALDVPLELDAALELMVKEVEPALVDLGKMGERWFANVSAGGFLAEVSQRVDPDLKSWAGTMAYLIGGAFTIFDFEPLRGVMHFSGHRRSFEASLFAVCNSRLQGGGKLIAPHAMLDDGLLDVCMIAPMPALEFVALLTRVAKGDHLQDDRVVYLQTDSVVFEFDRPVLVNTDGEVVTGSVCRYEVIRNATRFVAGRQWASVTLP